MTEEVGLDILMPAGLQSSRKVQEANSHSEVPTANYNVLSENLRKVTPNGIQCSFFCGGRRCKYENPDNWDSVHMAVDGVYSHWITDEILAMARPSTETITKKKIIEQFQSAGIRTIINLQKPGEHANCGNRLENSGFTYDPTIFMENNIYFYNFGWKDYGEATTTNLLDVVKVMAFALEQGKVAIHCHAGLGRTGVLIACYLVYSLRVRANDAIRFVRLKRPNSVQTRGQIMCVQEFEQFILPQNTVFCNKDFIKDKKLQDFSLSQYLLRQAIMLHGYEARILKYIPKIVHVLCDRILQLCKCHQPNDIEFTRTFVVTRINARRSHLTSTRSSRSASSEPSSDSVLISGSSTRRSSMEMDKTNATLSDEDVATASPSSTQCISPDMPSCVSGMSGLDDSCLDAILGDGIHGQQLHDNVCYQELSSQTDLQKASEEEDIVPYTVGDVVQALLAEHHLLGEGTKRYMKQFRIDLNHRQSAWMKLRVEKNLYVLTGLLFDWLEHLRVPILKQDDLSYIVIIGSQPENCLQKMNLATQYTLEYLLRFLVHLQPLPRNTNEDLIKRFVASLTHQRVVIQGTLKPGGKPFNKLREGTHRKVMEFFTKLFSLICDQRPQHTPVTPDTPDEMEELEDTHST